MDLSLKNLRMADGSLVDLEVKNGVITAIDPADEAASVGSTRYLFPGFVDVHVHLREPGFSHKETIATGSLACAHGGFTDVCAMPNLKPVPDSIGTLAMQQEIIDRDAVIRVHPYGAITAGQNGEALADLSGMAEQGAIAFSDDGRGVQDEAMMKAAMLEAKRLGKMIVAHCEDNSLLRGGYIHDGEYAKAHGHKGICSESEWGPIARDLKLAEETGVSYHVCHISTKESVQVIREAKQKGIDVTCETGPHYLLMDDSMLQEHGRFKMNPPIRGKEDREALVRGLLDGTIDMIATDHAPHSAEEKSKGLAGSLNGVVGIETSFATLYTGLVKTGILSLPRLIELMHTNAARRFGIAVPLAVGQKANFTVFELDTEYPIDPAAFCSMGKATPFEGWNVYGRCLLTVCDGKAAWKSPEVTL
ncbi:MAG: dihydroorotase [Oscillospiraceae bacterium]|nr:dihydroorotase [Oscillospiraceae bacterium]